MAGQRGRTVIPSSEHRKLLHFHLTVRPCLCSECQTLLGFRQESFGTTCTVGSDLGLLAWRRALASPALDIIQCVGPVGTLLKGPLH